MSFIIAIIFSLFLFCNTASAANLSIEIGKDSSSIAAGRDFGFGYGMLGISATYTTDSPWSYVETTESLNKPCDDFIKDTTKSCSPKGRFHDGDEWEIFGKLGYRLPVLKIFYLNMGTGISKQKISDLFVFGEDICTKSVGNTCTETREFAETWGQVKEHYYLNFLGGVTVEMTHRLLFNVDYHTRKGLISGFMWRF